MSTFGRVNKEASLLRDIVFAANDGIVTTFEMPFLGGACAVIAFTVGKCKRG